MRPIAIQNMAKIIVTERRELDRKGRDSMFANVLAQWTVHTLQDAELPEAFLSIPFVCNPMFSRKFWSEAWCWFNMVLLEAM